MRPRQPVTMGFAETEVNGRFTILIDGKPRYFGMTFNRQEIGLKVEELEKRCAITWDEVNCLPGAFSESATNNDTQPAERPRRIIMAKSKKNATVATETNGNNDGKRTKVKKMSLVDMLAAGKLVAGQKIQAFYGERQYSGTINADGSVKVGRTTYRSLSEAGRTIVREASGDATRQINGYTFFGTSVTVDGETKIASIDSLR